MRPNFALNIFSKIQTWNGIRKEISRVCLKLKGHTSTPIYIRLSYCPKLKKIVNFKHKCNEKSIKLIGPNIFLLAWTRTSGKVTDCYPMISFNSFQFHILSTHIINTWDQSFLKLLKNLFLYVLFSF